MKEGLLFINNMIYGVYTLIEDAENQIILEGIYNRASVRFINEFITQTPGCLKALRYFDCELLFVDDLRVVTKNQAIYKHSVTLKECIINWPLIEEPLPSLDDFPQLIRIPVIFRERIET